MKLIGNIAVMALLLGSCEGFNLKDLGINTNDVQLLSGKEKSDVEVEANDQVGDGTVTQLTVEQSMLQGGQEQRGTAAKVEVAPDVTGSTPDQIALAQAEADQALKESETIAQAQALTRAKAEALDNALSNNGVIVSASTTNTNTITMPVMTAPRPPQNIVRYAGPQYLAEQKLESGVSIKVLKEGSGVKCQAGQTAQLHYTGTLASNGHVFDTSYGKVQPMAFTIGDFRVVKCWEDAILQLSAGERADIGCPASSAYGEYERPGIPANSDLNFSVEVYNCA